MACVAVREADQVNDVSVGGVERRGAAGGVVGVIGMSTDDEEA